MMFCLRPDRRRATGFTLLEVLIALTLFSLILLTLYSGLHAAARSMQATEAQIRSNDALRSQLGFLQRLIPHAVPLTLYDGRDNAVLFQGEPDRLRFIAPLPAHRGGEWAYLVTLQAVRSGHNGDNLVLVYQPVREDIRLERAVPSGTPDVIILEHIDHIEFSYFGALDDNRPAGWHDRWEVADRLPELVRLQVILPDTADDPPVIIAPIRTQPLRGQLHQVLYAPAINVPGGAGRDVQDAEPQ